MGYDYTCDGCGSRGSTPAVMGQFSEEKWMTTDLGPVLQDAGYELGSTVTLCANCTSELLI